MKISNDKKKQILADKDELSVHEISKKYDIPPYEIKQIIKISEKKTPKWFYAVMISMPIIFLIALEIFLRIISYGYNFDQWIDAGQGKYGINENIARKYFTSGNFNPKTSEDYFDIVKKSNSYRVFILGGSSAEGFPYSPMGSFSHYVRRRLELVYPNTHIEVVNIGMSAINSYTLLDFLPGVLDQDPDLILIYAGHNEYYGALGVGSVQSFGSSRTLTRLMLYLNDFKTTQLIRNTMQWIVSSVASGEKESSGTLMANMPKDKFILLNSEEYKAGLQQFEDNFTDMLSMIKDKGVPVIISRLVSNLKDQKPFISTDTPGYKSADEIFNNARNEINKEEFTKADSLFILAKDLDALRFRAPEKMNEIIDSLGKEFHVPTVNMDSIFNAESPGGIVGDNLIVDHLHPNVKGYQLMGKAFYDAMEESDYLPKTEHPKIVFDFQDKETRDKFVFTRLDSVIGNYSIALLKENWPYVKENKNMSAFKHDDFVNLLKPKDFIESIAVRKMEGLSWVDAHLLAARTYLLNDDIKDYMRHIDVLQYQFPLLGDFNSIVSYFYYRKKLNLDDYTAKRVGIIQLYRGEFNEAIKYLSEAYKADPKDTLVLYNLSLAHVKKKEYKTALSTIEKCLALNPKYSEAKDLKQQIQIELKK